MATLERMVRITIEHMGDDADSILRQVETTHYAVFGDLTGEYLGSYAMVDLHRYDFTMDASDVERLFPAKAEV